MPESFSQTRFSFLDDALDQGNLGADHNSNPISNTANSVSAQDRMIHEWYRFVLSYPPHLVRDYLDSFDLPERSIVLDPFCGTGTTLVEAQLNHFQAVGLEANPFPAFASRVKTDWRMDPNRLEALSHEIAENTIELLAAEGFDDFTLGEKNLGDLRLLPIDAERALINNSISPIPLHKTLVLRDEINRYADTQEHKYLTLALAKALVTTIGNLRFCRLVGMCLL
jgi:hypothetical protein